LFQEVIARLTGHIEPVRDDERLTDGQGRTVDVRNTLIIMTPNPGVEYLVDQPAAKTPARCASM
jgi:ATP-dependent Clp protease ATP-binding subunit ClpB